MVAALHFRVSLCQHQQQGQQQQQQSCVGRAVLCAAFFAVGLGILSAFLGDDPALVLHAETAPAVGSASAEADGAFVSVVGWPLGAPGEFRRQMELSRLNKEAKVGQTPLKPRGEACAEGKRQGNSMVYGAVFRV